MSLDGGVGGYAQVDRNIGYVKEAANENAGGTAHTVNRLKLSDADRMRHSDGTQGISGANDIESPAVGRTPADRGSWIRDNV